MPHEHSTPELQIEAPSAVSDETFIADGSVWLVYLVRRDGVICSEYVGPAPTTKKPGAY